MADEARRGLAVLFATSEIHEALTMSNRIIVLSKGAIVGEFDPRDRHQGRGDDRLGRGRVDASGNVTVRDNGISHERAVGERIIVTGCRERRGGHWCTA